MTLFVNDAPRIATRELIAAASMVDRRSTCDDRARASGAPARARVYRRGLFSSHDPPNHNPRARASHRPRDRANAGASAIGRLDTSIHPRARRPFAFRPRARRALAARARARRSRRENGSARDAIAVARARVMRVVVVAGTQSGVGKTTIATALMLAYARRGMRVAAFKVGADFVDPIAHRCALRESGAESENLDGYMMTEAYARRAASARAETCDVAVVDGVMGLYDGRDGISEDGSTAQMAKWLGAGVLLVIDCNAMARSVAAVIKGYREFDADLNLLGVVFNKTGGEAHTEYLRESLEAVMADVEVFGGIPKDARGIATPDGVGVSSPYDDSMEQQIEHMAMLLEQNVDLDALLRAMPEFTVPHEIALELAQERADGGAEAASTDSEVRIAVARDEAFCFYYPENLSKLEEAGAKLVYFSPIAGEGLPQDIQGVIFGGGYPEFHAQALLKNRPLRSAVTAFATAGGVVYAECGGLMFLSQSLSAPDGSSPRSMCGVAPFATRLTSSVKTGYAEITIAPGNPLFPEGEVVRGQTFRYSEIYGDRPSKMRVTEEKMAIGWGATYEVRQEQTFGKGQSGIELDGFAWNNVLVSQIHLHFGANPSLAHSFVEACRKVPSGACEAANRAAMVSRRTMSKSFGPLTPISSRNFADEAARGRARTDDSGGSVVSGSPEKVKHVLPPRRARGMSRDFREYSVDLDSAEGQGMFRSRSSASMQNLGAQLSKIPGMPRKPSHTELDVALNSYFGAPQLMADHLHAPSQLQLPLPQSFGPIISLSPTATYTLYALGVGDRVVGITDACVLPDDVTEAPKVIARQSAVLMSPQSSANLSDMRKKGSGSGLSDLEFAGPGSMHHGSSYASLTRLESKSATHLGAQDKWSYFDVNFVRHAEARLIFTPDLCSECSEVRFGTAKYLHEAEVFLTKAEFESDDEAVLEVNAQRPSVFPVAPKTLNEVLDTILQIGVLCGQKERAVVLLAQLRSRLRSVARVVATADERPRVMSLEGIKPVVAAGHWLPEMKSIAGGIDEFHEPGGSIDRIRWEQVLSYAPDVLLLGPCYIGRTTEETTEKTLEQLEHLASQPGWWVIPAVRNRRVFILSHEITCQAGPQLVDGVEAMARIFHPDLFPMELRQGICLKFNLEEGKSCRPKQLRQYFTEWR